MFKNLLFLILCGVCIWQQHVLAKQRVALWVAVHDLGVATETLNDATFEIPPSPNIPRDEALRNLENPREQ